MCEITSAEQGCSALPEGRTNKKAAPVGGLVRTARRAVPTFSFHAETEDEFLAIGFAGAEHAAGVTEAGKLGLIG